MKAIACSMQALGMLFWHKHNFDKALADLPNFTPFPDEWTVEDKVLFEQAFSFHGKTFHRIRQMVCSPVYVHHVKQVIKAHLVTLSLAFSQLRFYSWLFL